MPTGFVVALRFELLQVGDATPGSCRFSRRLLK
jgi:hypothetical protein